MNKPKSRKPNQTVCFLKKSPLNVILSNSVRNNFFIYIFKNLTNLKYILEVRSHESEYHFFFMENSPFFHDILSRLMVSFQ